MKLLNSGNAKTRKGEKRGYITYGIHLAPSNLSGFNVCQFASNGCAEACLNTAGRGAMTSVQKARIAKTRLFFTAKDLFMDSLWSEVSAAIKAANRKSMTAVFRLNLTSDLPWHKLTYNGKTIMQAFPEAQFYDYTKDSRRVIDWSLGLLRHNYHLTFSRSETSQNHDLKSLLNEGINVAIVFADQLPLSWDGYRVIDGDLDDLRFLDPKGVVVGLRAKGRGKVDASGFVLQPEGLMRL